MGTCFHDFPLLTPEPQVTTNKKVFQLTHFIY